jgi:cytidylate kinase
MIRLAMGIGWIRRRGAVHAYVAPRIVRRESRISRRESDVGNLAPRIWHRESGAANRKSRIWRSDTEDSAARMDRHGFIV